MRKETFLTRALFSKEQDSAHPKTVTLPRTWNNLDGQDGVMLSGMTPDIVFSMAGDKFPPNSKVMINEQLTKIKKSRYFHVSCDLRDL